MQTNRSEVVIIGGGLAGLTAAKTLNDAGISFRLFEASSRFGGRIDALHDPEDGRVLADLGPTWVWPEYQSDAARWLEKLQIPTFAQYEEGKAVLDLDPRTLPRHQFLPGQHGIRRPVGGPQAIIDVLVSQLPEQSLQLNKQVIALSVDGSDIQISIVADTENHVHNARHIILAIPLRVAEASIEWNGLLTENILNAMSQVPTWMATQAKLGVVYEKPFWREQELSGRVASHIGPMGEIHDISPQGSGVGALFGFIGVPYEARLAKADELKHAAIAQLVRCYGSQAADFSQFYIKDWAQEKLICAPLDLKNAAQHPDVLSAQLRQPHANGGIQFGVAETADRDPGLIAGAFQAGERAAKNVISLLSNQ